MTHPDTLTIPRAVVEQALEAMEALEQRCKEVKRKLDADIPDGEPVHDCSSRLTFPMAMALGASEKLRAALQPQAAESPAEHDYRLACEGVGEELGPPEPGFSKQPQSAVNQLSYYKELFTTLASNPDAILEIEASMNYWCEVPWQEAFHQLAHGTRIRVKPDQIIKIKEVS